MKEGFHQYPVWAILAATLAVAAGLRLYGLGAESLWMDEVRQVSYAYNDTDLLTLVNHAASQNQPALDYIVGYLFAAVLPFSELTARLPAFIFGTLAVGIYFLLAFRLMGLYAAILASVALALSPTLLYFAQEARPYSIFLFLLSVYLCLFFDILQNPKKYQFWWWVGLVIVTTLLLHSRGMAPVTSIVALNCAMVSYSIVGICYRKWSEGPSCHRCRSITLSQLRNLIVVSVVAGLLFFPNFFLVWSMSKTYLGGAESTEQWAVHEPILYLAYEVFPPVFGIFLWPALAGAIFAVSCLVIERKRNPFIVLFVVYALLEPLISVYAYFIVVDTSVLKPKSNYFVQSFCLITIVAAYGYIEVLNRISCMRRDAAVQRSGFLLLVAGLVVLVLPDVRAYYSNEATTYRHPMRKANYRDAVEYLVEEVKVGPDDLIIYDTFRSHGDWEPHLYGSGLYYDRDMFVKQYNWKRWLEARREDALPSGDLYLVMHEGTTAQARYTDGQRFVEEKFHQVRVIYPRRFPASVEDTALLYIEEVLRFFPENSSRVDPLLAKAEILCERNRLESRTTFQAAKELMG